MAYNRKWDGKRFVLHSGLAAGSLYLLQTSGPIFWANGAINLLSAGAGLTLAVSGTIALSDALWLAGKYFNDRDVKTPRQRKGRSRWIRSIKELRHDIIPHGKWGPYWGSLRKGRDAIFADFASNAVCLGPNGQGKDVRAVQTNCLSIRESKTVVDFKSDVTCVLAAILLARGETIRVLNFGGVNEEIIGPSDTFNPLHIAADNFWREGGIADVSADVSEMALQLYSEPKSESGGNDNRYFRDGSRSLIALAIMLVILIKGYEATLGDVLQLLNDRETFLHHALWAAGRLEQEGGSTAQIPLHESPWAKHQSFEAIEAFADYLRGLASGIADLLIAEDSRTFDSFITGAVQAMAPFNITTRAHKITQTSSFRFSDQKENGETVTVFLVADSSRMEAQRPILELVQWCMLNEWKRHPNKKKPVYLIGNEAGNFKILDLASLLTWGRAYGIRLFLFLQSFAAFRITYGKETLNTLLSEQEILQILPGQSDPETLKLIEEMLGQYAYMGHNYKTEGTGPLNVKGGGFNEDVAPLMTAEEIRRCQKTILFIRKNRPALTHTPSIAAIAPWRSQQAINPFYGKPYRLPVELRLHFRGWSLGAVWRWTGRRVRQLFSSWRAR
jgi:type IV secretion system protein VirD4